MKKLNGQTLYEALRTCEERPGYQVGIACCGEWSVREFIQAIEAEFRYGSLDGWRCAQDFDILRYQHALTLRYYKNGSTIRVFSAYENKIYRSQSFHQILVEDGIADIVSNALKECEQWYTDSNVDDTEKNEELDEFLSEFKIIERSATV